MAIFEINGIKYQNKPEPQVNPRRMPPMLMGMMMMAEMAMPGYYGGVKKQREMPHVNIIDEYGLIQQKKSTLSKSQRDWVVHTFETNFIVVPSGQAEKIKISPTEPTNEAQSEACTNTDVMAALPPQMCYKSNEPCKYNCSGLCRDSY